MPAEASAVSISSSFSACLTVRGKPSRMKPFAHLRGGGIVVPNVWFATESEEGKLFP